MAQAPDLDSNQWYHMYVTSGPAQAFVANSLSDESSAVYFRPTNTTQPAQRWQVFRLNSTAWTLRCQAGGPNAWLGTFLTSDTGETRPRLDRGDIADDSVYWNFGPWGDGTWYLWNYANATKNHLEKQGNGLLIMSPNITAPASGQRWAFEKIAPVDDQQYSTISLLGAVVATSTTASGALSSSTTTPTSSPNANANTSSSGLSTGAQAAIGASIGGVAIIALVVLGLFLWRRRKQRQASPVEPKYQVHHNETEQQPPLTKYGMYHDVPIKHELASNGLAEAPANERLVELPGHAVQR